MSAASEISVRESEISVKECIRKTLLSSGAVAIGFAEAGRVDPEETEAYRRWIEGGNHAGMEYLKRHATLKSHPSSVLEGVSTVISMAFSYAQGQLRDSGLPAVARYAYGQDYHDVLRARISPLVEQLKSHFGGEWRICIDSAPLPERYWARKCGIGRSGKNGSVIVDKFGSYIFLAEVLTTLPVVPDKPETGHCAGCGACVRACPQNALHEDGTVDAAKCINYLTIEHRGPWEVAQFEAMHTAAARHSLFGCDICQEVCPHNRDVPPTEIPEFLPSPEMLGLTAGDVLGMTKEEFSRFFKGSPLKRAKYEGLRRNAANVAGNINESDGTDDVPPHGHQ